MKQTPIVFTILVVSIASAGCQSGQSSSSSPSATSAETSNQKQSKSNDLDRQTALSLAKEKISSPVTRWIWRNETRKLDQYTKLIEDNVISCGKHYTIVGRTDIWEYVNCQPAANGRGLVARGNELVLILGSKIPSEVTGISKADQNSATVDVVLSFQQGDGYGLMEKYPDLFGMHPDHFKDEQKQLSFRLYDDGWRVRN